MWAVESRLESWLYYINSENAFSEQHTHLSRLTPSVTAQVLKIVCAGVYKIAQGQPGMLQASYMQFTPL